MGFFLDSESDVTPAAMVTGGTALGPLVHIGYHRTGSTWLQVFLFSNPKTGFALPWDQAEPLRRFVLVDPLSFEAQATRKAFEQGLAEAQLAGKVPTITHERLSGSPYSGGHDRASIAVRLREVFPEGRILIVIREQKRIIQSIYTQYVRQGGAASIRTFLQLPERHEGDLPRYERNMHEYHRLIKHYFELFGRGRVLVLPYELLRRDRVEFLSEIFSLVDLPPYLDLGSKPLNTSIRGTTVAIKRRLNLLFARNSLNISAPLHFRGANWMLARLSDEMDRLIPDFVHRRIEDRLRRVVSAFVGRGFAESNQITAELTGLDLAGYGYDL